MGVDQELGRVIVVDVAETIGCADGEQHRQEQRDEQQEAHGHAPSAAPHQVDQPGTEGQRADQPAQELAGEVQLCQFVSLEWTRQSRADEHHQCHGERRGNERQ